jgi:lipopolysaccharide transport system permease protein
LIAQLWASRPLLLTLVRRQYQLRYRQSFAGIGWAIVPPLATLAVATLVFDQVAGVDTGKVPYVMFALAALVPWTFFSTSLTFGITSVVNEKFIVTRLAFPRAVLPLSMIGTALIDLFAAILVFLVFVLFTGIGLPITALWFPVLIMIELVLVTGVVLLASAMNVFARDVRQAVPVVTQLWLFVTPVMYPLSKVPEQYRGLMEWLNPMAGVVETSRLILLEGKAPNIELLIPALVGAAAMLILGGWYFGSTEQRFADAI